MSETKPNLKEIPLSEYTREEILELIEENGGSGDRRAMKLASD
jgi:hypothetical protein